MLIRKIAPLSNVNKLGIYIFKLYSFKGDDLVIIADDGFPDSFRAEFRFSEVMYVTCPTGFVEKQFRIMTKQEIPLSQRYPNYTTFCFEEPLPHLSKEPERYFIIARDVEIMVHSSGDNLDRIEDLLEPLGMNPESGTGKSMRRGYIPPIADNRDFSAQEGTDNR